MRRRIIATILMLVLVFGCAGESFAAANKYTKALGSTVHSYTKESGSFKLTKNARFFVVSESLPSKELRQTVRLLNSEFASKKKPTKNVLPIVYGKKSQAQDGDIIIRVASSGFTAEGYRLEVAKKRVYVTAGTTDGIFYGLRTLLKYFMSSGENSIPCCLIKDRPDVKERTMHLDCGRKYFTKTWIKNHIKKMSWMGYNAIELHFSEDQGLRLESKSFPWLAGSYNGNSKYLTQDAMAEICAVAKRYHVEVIPSFDSPGHMNYILKKYKNYVKAHPGYSFTYNGKRYNKNSKGFKNISNYFKYNGKKTNYNYISIDLTNPTARAFTAKLINEYADFFKRQGCTKFNIGGDELLGWSNVTVGGRTFTYYTKWKALQHWDSYAKNVLDIKNGNATDTFISYMNSTAKRLEKKGYTCRVWSDEINRESNQHVSLKKSIHIVYWSNKYAPLSKLKKKGYKFHNAVSLWTYYVTTPGGGYKRSNKEDIYKYWNPKNFADPFKSSKTVPASQYAGAYFCVWCDYAYRYTTSEIWTNISGRMWSSSTIMWNTQVRTKYSGNKTALSYSRFTDYRKKLAYFPGFTGDPLKASSLPEASTFKPVPVEEVVVPDPVTPDPEPEATDPVTDSTESVQETTE